MSREVRRDLANTRRCIGEMYRDGLGTARNKTASARRKRAAGHLRQVEKKHSHDPHPGVTGQLEYDHPVSYKPQMILNSEVMEQMYETNPEEAAKYVFVSKMPGEASWKTDAQRAAEAAASSSQHLRK